MFTFELASESETLKRVPFHVFDERKTLINFGNVFRDQYRANMAFNSIPVSDNSMNGAAAASIEDVRIIIKDAYKETYSMKPLCDLKAMARPNMSLTTEQTELQWRITKSDINFTKASQVISNNRSSSVTVKTGRHLYIISGGFDIPGLSLTNNSWQASAQEHISDIFNRMKDAESQGIGRGDADLLLMGMRTFVNTPTHMANLTWGSTSDADYIKFVEKFPGYVSWYRKQLNLYNIADASLDIWFPAQIFEWLNDKMWPNDVKNETCWNVLTKNNSKWNFKITTELDADPEIVGDMATVWVSPVNTLKKLTVTPEPIWYVYPNGRDIRMDFIQQVGGIDMVSPDACRKIKIPKA